MPDGVIVGSAFIKLILDSANEKDGWKRLKFSPQSSQRG